MNKDEYLDLLKLYLQDLPSDEIQDILLDYEEHFSIGVSKGKSEEEISKELGSPKYISDNYKGTVETAYAKSENSADYYSTKGHNDNTRKLLIVLLLIFFNLIIVLGPALGLVGILFSFFISAISIIFAGGALMLGFPAILFIPSVELHLLTTISFGIGLIALGILGVILSVFLTKFLYGLGIKYFNWNIELINK